METKQLFKRINGWFFAPLATFHTGSMQCGYPALRLRDLPDQDGEYVIEACLPSGTVVVVAEFEDWDEAEAAHGVAGALLANPNAQAAGGSA